MWAVLAWLSIMEYNNRSGPSSVADVVRKHWKEYGRNYYSRYDYEVLLYFLFPDVNTDL